MPAGRRPMAVGTQGMTVVQEAYIEQCQSHGRHALSSPSVQIANSWRTTGDISPNWESMLRCLDNTIGLSEYAKPVRVKGFQILHANFNAV